MRIHFPRIEQDGRIARARGGTASGKLRRVIIQPQIEGLESRRLLSVVVNEYPLDGGAQQQGIIAGPDGNLWFTEPSTGKIGQINPTTHAIMEFPILTPTGGPDEIAKGPDGNLWFTENNADNIGMINPTTHAVAEFPIPTADSHPVGIVAGPDGNLWFTEFGTNKIGEINPTTQKVVNEFPTLGNESNPSGITVGPDGNLWFTESNRNAIGQINPTTGRVIDFPIPTTNLFPNPGGDITLGPDGNLWFTEPHTSGIGRLDPTKGVVTNFSIPAASSDPTGIVAGPDGDLWFIEQAGNKVGQIDPATGAVSETAILTPGVHPEEITPGPDGNLWFTEQGYINSNLPNYPRFSNLGQVVIPAEGAPDLSIVGTVPPSVPSESPVTFNLTVTNHGSGTATSVKVTDTLPFYLDFISATGGVTDYDDSNDELSFTLGDLAAGASINVSFMVGVEDTGKITDQAQVTMDQVDPTPNDNHVTLTTNVFSNTADLALSGTAPASVVYGQGYVTFSITVKNAGQTEATSVTLNDIPPDVGFFSSATGGVTPDSNHRLIFRSATWPLAPRRPSTSSGSPGSTRQQKKATSSQTMLPSPWNSRILRRPTTQ